MTGQDLIAHEAGVVLGVRFDQGDVNRRIGHADVFWLRLRHRHHRRQRRPSLLAAPTIAGKPSELTATAPPVTWRNFLRVKFAILWSPDYFWLAK